jgi:hypothetical protein
MEEVGGGVCCPAHAAQVSCQVLVWHTKDPTSAGHLSFLDVDLNTQHACIHSPASTRHLKTLPLSCVCISTTPRLQPTWWTSLPLWLRCFVRQYTTSVSQLEYVAIRRTLLHQVGLGSSSESRARGRSRSRGGGRTSDVVWQQIHHVITSLHHGQLTSYDPQPCYCAHHNCTSTPSTGLPQSSSLNQHADQT